MLPRPESANVHPQVAYALYRGHKFLVHPSAFIVHVPHPQSAAQKVWGVKVTPELPTYNELLNQTGRLHWGSSTLNTAGADVGGRSC
jgi:hypothetical protein